MWKKLRRGLLLALIAAPGILISLSMTGAVTRPAGGAVAVTQRESAGDALAVMLVSLPVALLAVFTGFGWMLFRRRPATMDSAQALMHEICREENPPRPAPSPSPATPDQPVTAPWERPADWWKKEAR